MAKADFTGGAQGAIGGASTGAAIGGVPGALVGGLLGGAAGLFGGGKKKKKKKRSSLDKNQQALNQSQYEGIIGKGPLADLYNYDPELANEVFDKTIANPAYRKFKEDLAPGITGQFRNQGLMNSSYAGDALSKVARDIQEGLDAQRSKYLFDTQSDIKNSKRNAIENFQNRQTFAYDTAAPSNSGFDINQVLNSIKPEDVEKLYNWLK